MTSIRRRMNTSNTSSSSYSSLPVPGATKDVDSMGRKYKNRRSQILKFLIAISVSAFAYSFFTRTGKKSVKSDLSHHAKVTQVQPSLGEEAVVKITREAQLVLGQNEEVLGHANFDDGRKQTTRKEFLDPKSQALHHVNVMLGNDGPEPDLSGGMIPAVAPPFAMTRWTPQTRQHYVSMCPYNQTDDKIHGFLGTHQPAVWMGESGPAQISPGLGEVQVNFEDRGLRFEKKDEYGSANYYSNLLHADQGDIEAELSASSRVGHMRFTFHPHSRSKAVPHVILQASRESVLLSGWATSTRRPDNISYPLGEIHIDEERQEVWGWNDERQDHILLSEELSASSFKGYFVARFSCPFKDIGVSMRGQVHPGAHSGLGQVVAGYVTFAEDTPEVEVRVGVSFISIDQARRNIDLEIPDTQTLEMTSKTTRQAWSDKLDSISIKGATPHNLTVYHTSHAHALVYPYEIHENTEDGPAYYSGYLDKVVPGESYSGYSIWDTFRATTAWQLLDIPELVPGMITSMLQDYEQGGWLPMWKNLVESNIMIGTHADSIIAQAMVAGVKGFDWNKAWQAVRKDAYTPPDRDTELRFEDREEHTPQEVRAGLTEYMKLGYVAADLHSESASRTLDYAYDDWAAAVVADHVGAHEDATALRNRSQSWRYLWNKETGFMEARNSDGGWAGEKEGWTEGDHWAYSLEVLHDTPGLIDLMGGNQSFIEFMERHFDGGHNLHTNEPSHHIPYLYMYAGSPHKAQERVRQIGENEYNHTALGLSGNEDCGQMSAWYLFSAMGLYPVNPASGEYVIGTPFFDQFTFRIPGAKRPLSITAKGASEGKKYIKDVIIDGQEHKGISIWHDQIAGGAEIVFEMSDTPQMWGM